MIFQIDSPTVKEAFKLDNYAIEYAEENDLIESDLCVIYFSSNEIYYPNTLKSFEYSILKRDKYEWKRNKFPKGKKHIFIRDLHKQWYLSGINDNLNDPEKLLHFLKNETEGYRVITVGSSAGGFAALLFGNMLECERIYAFNAQLNLRVTMRNSNPLIDPILFNKENDKDSSLYYNLGNYLNANTSNYYFQSCYSNMDIVQLKSISDEAQNKLKIIRFQTSNHGFPFLRINLKYVLKFSSDELNQLVNNTFHPLTFSIRLIGLVPTVIYVLKEFKDRFQKKCQESNFKKH
jgi:hypothetical protein